MDWHELHKKKVDELRELAKEHAGVDAASGLHKDQLIEIVAQVLGIEKPHLEVETGFDKGPVKRKIKELKAEVGAAIEAKDRKAIKEKRREIHRLKRQIRRAAHLTH
jgi:hypothetical protein